MGCSCSKNNDMSKGLDKCTWSQFQFDHQPYKGQFTPFFQKWWKIWNLSWKCIFKSRLTCYCRLMSIKWGHEPEHRLVNIKPWIKKPLTLSCPWLSRRKTISHLKTAPNLSCTFTDLKLSHLKILQCSFGPEEVELLWRIQTNFIYTCLLSATIWAVL